MIVPQQRRVVLLGWCARILALCVSLVAVRINLRLLGEAQFAVFQLLTAAFAWLTLCSLGMGPAVKNIASEFRARAMADGVIRDSAAAILTILFLVCLVLLVAAAPIASHLLLRKLEHDRMWSYRAFVIGGVLSLVGALGQVGTELLYAEFRARWVYMLSIVSSMLTLAILGVLSRVTAPPTHILVLVVCAMLGPPAVMAVVTLRMTGLLMLRLVRPDPLALRRLLHLALRFWGFAILSSLILLVDYLVISQILAAQQIVLYSVMMKVAAVGVVLFTTVIAVVWPEWTHYWELGQWSQLRRKVFLLATLGVASCVPIAVAGIFVLPIVIRIWLHTASVTPSVVLIVEVMGYLAIRFWTDVHSAALMSGNRVFAATMFAAAQALITAPLEFLFGRGHGPEGVVFGLIVGFLLTAAWMFPFRFYREVTARLRREHAPT